MFFTKFSALRISIFIVKYVSIQGVIPMHCTSVILWQGIGVFPPHPGIF